MRSSELAVATKNTFERSNGQIEIVVVKLEVLRRVENLEKRRRWVTPKIASPTCRPRQHHSGFFTPAPAQPLE